MRIAYIAFLIIIFTSCDPSDDRLVIRNRSGRSLIARFCFVKDNKLHETWGGVRPISNKEVNTISIMDSWESEFKYAGSKDLFIIIHDIQSFTYSKELNLRFKSDSLINAGKYVYKAMSYEELKAKDWNIVYPDDDFEKGNIFQ